MACVLVLALATMAACSTRKEKEDKTIGATTVDGYELVFDETSKFGRVMVGDRDSQRCLAIDSFHMGMQSCMDLDDRDSVVYEYIELMPVALAFAESSDNVLMLGLGGGSLARLLVPAVPEMTMDVVEVDPVIVEAARRFFGVGQGQRLRIHVADGREFLAESSSSWDIIVLDVFGSDYIPFSLATREFLELVKQRTKPGGAVVANLWSSRKRRFRAQLKTMAEVFSSVAVFDSSRDDSMVVVASDAPQRLTEEQIVVRARRLDAKLRRSLALEAKVDRLVPLESFRLDDVPVIEDAKPDVFKALSTEP